MSGLCSPADSALLLGGRASTKSNDKTCIANLRNIATALTSYTADNNGFIPPYASETWADPPGVQDGRSLLMRCLGLPATGWVCPNALQGSGKSNYGTVISPGFSYETGLELLRTARLPHNQGIRVAATDRSGSQLVFLQDIVLPVNSELAKYAYPHRDHGNALYVDGHVAPFIFTSLDPDFR